MSKKNTTAAAAVTEVPTEELLAQLEEKHAKAPEVQPVDTFTIPAGTTKAIFQRPSAYTENEARMRSGGSGAVTSWLVWELLADGSKRHYHAYSFSGPSVEPVEHYGSRLPVDWVPYAVPGYGSEQLPTAPKLWFRTDGELTLWTQPRQPGVKAALVVAVPAAVAVQVEVPNLKDANVERALSTIAAAIPATVPGADPTHASVAADSLRALIGAVQGFETVPPEPTAAAKARDPAKYRTYNRDVSRNGFNDLPDSPAVGKSLVDAWQAVRDYLRTRPFVGPAQTGAYHLGQLAAKLPLAIRK